MKIRPLIGLGNLLLGTSKEAVLDILGSPDEKWTDEYSDGILSEEWRFASKQLELSFHSVDDWVLSTITICNNDATFDGMKVIGITVEELIERIPSLILDDDLGDLGKDFEMPGTKLSFWIVHDRVQSVSIFPEYEEDNETVKWPKRS